MNAVSRAVALSSLRRIVHGTCAAFLLALPALAADLTIGVPITPTSMDPHYHNVSQNISPLSHVLEPLVFVEGTKDLSPALAVSWRAIDDKTWEFKLRPGVKFHDGSDFTAEDVAFTLRRVPKVPNPLASSTIFTRSIAEIIVVDPMTVHLKTIYPDAELPVNMSQLLVLSHKAAAGPAAEGKTTQQLNAGEGLIGTGPYKFVGFTPGERVTVTANRNYWGKAPMWDNVTLKVITSDATRTAAVLSGEIDAAMVPGESLDRLKASPNVKVTTGDTCFFVYLAMDQFEKTATVTGTDGRNPLRDPRVRRALSLAIDRNAISQRVLLGLAKPTAELGPASIFGTTPGVTPDPFDLDQARKLLAEAGYPQGFGITLHTPSGVFVGDTQIGQAVAAMWTRAGVKTTVESVVSSQFYSRRNNRDYSAYATNFCPYTGQMSYSVRLLGMTRDLPKANGTINVSGYSNPQVDRLITEALATVDDAKRAALVQQASKIVVKDEHAVLSLVQLGYVYATKKNLTLRTRMDTYLTAMQITPDG